MTSGHDGHNNICEWHVFGRLYPNWPALGMLDSISRGERVYVMFVQA